MTTAEKAVYHRAGWHRRRQQLWPICGQRFAIAVTRRPEQVTCKRCEYMLAHGTLGMFRVVHLDEVLPHVDGD